MTSYLWMLVPVALIIIIYKVLYLHFSKGGGHWISFEENKWSIISVWSCLALASLYIYLYLLGGFGNNPSWIEVISATIIALVFGYVCVKSLEKSQ